MARTVTAGAHVRLTPTRAATADDDAKARQVLDELRRGIERYHDYRVALDEGFRIFAPEVEQRVYHFTNYRRALRESRRFEPAEPSSLLYEKSGDGYRLVGAMFTARRDATTDELEARVPLSLARWHAHVDICVPRWRERDRWHEVHDGKPVFGPAGTIATRGACEAAGGRFLDQVFGWMVHVNVLESEPHRIWGSREQHGHAP